MSIWSALAMSFLFVQAGEIESPLHWSLYRTGLPVPFQFNVRQNMSVELNDDELLLANPLELNREQMRRRHRLLTERRPLPGALKPMTKAEIELVVTNLLSTRPDIMSTVRHANAEFKRTGNDEPFQAAMFTVIRASIDMCGELGFPSNTYDTTAVAVQIRILAEVE